MHIWSKSSSQVLKFAVVITASFVVLHFSLRNCCCGSVSPIRGSLETEIEGCAGFAMSPQEWEVLTSLVLRSRNSHQAELFVGTG